LVSLSRWSGTWLLGQAIQGEVVVLTELPKLEDLPKTFGLLPGRVSDPVPLGFELARVGSIGALQHLGDYKVSLGELTLVFGVGRGLRLVKLNEAGRVHLHGLS
jgi:hypothetical protein